MKIIIALFTLSTLPLLTWAQSQEVTVEEVKQLMEAGTQFIDVREESELKDLEYCIEGVIHLPLSNLDSLQDMLEKDQSYIVACRSGNRSMKAINRLHELGFSDLHNLKGGILEWQSKGLPVIKKGVLPKSCGTKASSSCTKASKSSKKGCCSSTSKGHE
jgi:rhodanese-related sulfurtransferase